jgi:hypothetical protein
MLVVVLGQTSELGTQNDSSFYTVKAKTMIAKKGSMKVNGSIVNCIPTHTSFLIMPLKITIHYFLTSGAHDMIQLRFSIV